ncbi:putative C6 finger domain protein [Arthroderma uncinatum]|uniref:putative C6 finger domain protein n=1 Tax=Arthroderma uncinatum TaxID=74035 RepID=UPI00144AB99A|nr:putative C6 finger domain protein [Arthroderma uncinatum]KAF3483209.1 putative C6 finger domain protein [Arthroderma uncinatum]
MESFRRALSGDTDTSQHDQEPQRKKMRKGTKSCYECRRRKIRCTYAAARPGICNECHARGSSCIDQEHAPMRAEAAKLRVGDQSYSLRERVAALEHTVSKMVRRMDESDNGISNERASWPYMGSPTESVDRDTKALGACPQETVPETIPARSNSTDLGRTGPDAAPLLTLFDNHIFTRDEKNPDAEASKSADPVAIKSKRVALALRELLPSPVQLKKLLGSTAMVWNIWRARFPEIFKPEALENPADVGKILFSIVMTIDQDSTNFDLQSLKIPMSRDKYVEQCLAAIEKYILDDDDIASSLSGIECIYMAGKYYSNIGRPRKAWLLTRRGINFAQLSGLHLPNNRPSSDDALGVRQLHIWCGLACADLYQSSLLGLPYSVPTHLLAPHITHLLKVKKMDPGEAHMLRVCIPLGSIIDRNQDGGNMSLPLTLKIDQELEAMVHLLSSPFVDDPQTRADWRLAMSVARILRLDPYLREDSVSYQSASVIEKFHSSSYLQGGIPLPEPNLDVNLNLNLMDDAGGFGNPNLNLDLFLGQGWNFDWMDGQGFQPV